MSVLAERRVSSLTIREVQTGRTGAAYAIPARRCGGHPIRRDGKVMEWATVYVRLMHDPSDDDAAYALSTHIVGWASSLKHGLWHRDVSTDDDRHDLASMTYETVLLAVHRKRAWTKSQCVALVDRPDARSLRDSLLSQQATEDSAMPAGLPRGPNTFDHFVFGHYRTARRAMIRALDERLKRELSIEPGRESSAPPLAGSHDWAAIDARLDAPVLMGLVLDALDERRIERPTEVRAFELAVLEGLDNQQVAAKLRLPVGTVRVYVSRTKAYLRTAVGARDNERRDRQGVGGDDDAP